MLISRRRCRRCDTLHFSLFDAAAASLSLLMPHIFAIILRLLPLAIMMLMLPYCRRYAILRQFMPPLP
jgi:hypothetical protein